MATNMAGRGTDIKLGGTPSTWRQPYWRRRALTGTSGRWSSSSRRWWRARRRRPGPWPRSWGSRKSFRKRSARSGRSARRTRNGCGNWEGFSS
ncbi:hypothetical protein ACNJGB_21235, partial [Mycobacterium tuberculosis]